MSTPTNRLPRNVLILAFVALFSGLGQDLITPVLPGYLSLIGVSAAGIGLIDGLLQGITYVFRVVSGTLSDRLQNRKGLVFLGYALSSLARPLLAFAHVFPVAAVLRSVDGIGKGMKDAPRDALVADAAALGLSGKAFGFHRLVDTLGSVIGPAIAAGVLIILTPSLQAYRDVFLLSAVPGLIALVLIGFGVREPETRVQRVGSRGPFPVRFWLFVGGMTLAMLTKVNDSLFLLRASAVGVSPSYIPLVFAGFTLVYALSSYPLGVWSDRIGKMPLIIAGWVTLAAVELGFAIQPGLVATLILFAFYGLFYALTEGSARAIIADIVPAEVRGSAYAIFATSVGLAVIIGGYGMGRIWQNFSPQAGFLVAAAGSIVGAAVLFLLHRRRFA